MNGACVLCKTTRLRIPGAARTSLTCTPSLKARLWTTRSTRIGNASPDPPTPERFHPDRVAGGDHADPGAFVDRSAQLQHCNATGPGSALSLQRGDVE